MWPFKKQVKPYLSLRPVRKILAKGIDSETLSKAYTLLCNSLEQRLRIGYLSPIKQEQNVRDIHDITKEMCSLTCYYPSNPEVLPRKRVIEIAHIIRKASEYVKGTAYETIVSSKKRSFLENVIIGREVYKSHESLISTLWKKTPQEKAA